MGRRERLRLAVIGAAIVTTAVLPHLAEAHGKAIYLSSVSGSITPPWPGLGAYAVSKAALEKLVEAYRAEHPEVGFTRLTVGECFGGEGEGLTGFTDSWDHELAAELVPKWMASNYMSGAFIDVEDLVTVVDGLVRGGSSVSLHSITLAPRSASGS